MIKLSDELVQGLAIGDAAAMVVFEQIATAAALAEDEARTANCVKVEMAMDDGLGGWLVPSGVTVEIATRLGMPRLRDMLGWDIRVRAAIRDKPRWWQWLFHNYSTNKIASFLVWRWPKFPDVVNAYDDCARAHQEERERRGQKAYEFLKERREGHNNDHQANLD